MQLVVFWSNFDEILLNNNIQKRIIFIQNKDIAAARLLGYSYGELLIEYLLYLLQDKDNVKCVRIYMYRGVAYTNII